jgi:hypothetical protein
MRFAANYMRARERCPRDRGQAPAGEENSWKLLSFIIQASRRLVDKYPKSAILSGSNQVLPDCILNQFRIAPNVKHFHDSIFVKSDGASGNV